MDFDEVANLICRDTYRNVGAFSPRILFRYLLGQHAMYTGAGLLIQFRLCSWLQTKHGPIWAIARKLLVRRYKKTEALCGVELTPGTSVGPGLRMPHKGGIVIHPNAVIGSDCEIAQCVTIGNNLVKSRYAVAVIGDGVILCAGTKVIGAVKIGDNVCVGANSVVTRDLPNNSICAGVPCRVLREGKRLFPLINVDY